MMLSGWLTNLQYYVIIPEIVYLSELFPHIAVDSSTAATLPLANEEPYCMWNSNDQSALNFKERDIPIALIFTIDHNLTPTKLKQVLDIYHAIACLLPNNSNYLYAAVLHLPKNPKLYFGKLLNIQKLHQSFEDSGEATKDQKPLIRWLIDKIIVNVTMTKMSHWSHWQYELERKDNIGEQLKDRKNRNIFEGTRLLLSHAIIEQTKNEFINKTIIKKSLMEFLRELIVESVVADAIFSMDLTNNWIKYDFDDFKKPPQSLIIFQGWTWLLNLLRIMFFIVGAFVMLITTCAICGFACILSSILRDDYFRRRQRREQDEALRILQERFYEAGMNIHFNAFNDPPPQFDRQSNSETNTAIEQLSTISEDDLTQSDTNTSSEIIYPKVTLSLTPKQIALCDTDDSKTETIIETCRSHTEIILND
ncbi:unnamed protein product [Brugia pahangi]|uniref:Uncharacterized protein n=1 Tax=Brugia pahangi TaxID=6280 RepID=A0A0N4TVU3_BRUPA|nr:unnamed protein product [Brugia pahangi]